MRVECYGASRPQQGRTTNEDAFLIIRDGIPDVPGAVLDAASRTGRWDDMTVVALRLVGR